MQAIDNQRIREECGVCPVQLKETFHAIILDMDSEAHAGNEAFAMHPETFADPLNDVREIHISETAAVAIDHATTARTALEGLLQQMENEAYVTTLQTQVLEPLCELESFLLGHVNKQGPGSINQR